MASAPVAVRAERMASAWFIRRSSSRVTRRERWPTVMGTSRLRVVLVMIGVLSRG
ncbi:hypothetical protein [Nonomuraea dietziae]|uniref:hypothetical protein n=1 Tax=Nonomuraea dietziae TaxID=65515 RepID=UPI0031D214D7